MSDHSSEKKVSRSDNIIPDYQHLFEEKPDQGGKVKTGFFKKIVKMNFPSVAGATVLYLFQYAPVWITPLFTAHMINIVTDSLTENAGVTSAVWYSLAVSSAVIALFLILNIPFTMWRNKVFCGFLRRTSAGIKSAVVRKLQSLSITYHKDLETGKIQSKFLKDTEAVDGLLNNFFNGLFINVINGVIAAAISLKGNLYVSLFFVVVIPINVLLTHAFRKKIRKSYRDYRLKTESMSARLTNMLSMMEVTRAHGLEKAEISSVDHSIADLKSSGMKMDMVNAKFGSTMWVVNMLLYSLCVVFCIVLAVKKIINVGDIVLYQSMFSTITGAVLGIINIIPALGSGFEALRSVSEIMNVKEVEINIGKKDVPDIDGQITFENVYYKYPNSDQYVIKNLSFKAEKGECIAVVGASGSGKSTIMNLIIGFLTPNQGKVLIDGKPLEEFNLSEYRHHISVVPQSSILFSGTIRENITYGLDKYTESDLARAVELSNLEEFLKDLPHGLDTNIGEHGDKLSGGQKQRITIARALIRNPRILILDEATSALDNISEFHVQKAISESVKGRTTFIVAHRLSTIRDADRIIVMENGECVETGTFEELLSKKGKFYELKTLNDINIRQAESALA